MMNENNLTQEQLFALVQMASKKLGTTPEKLAKTAETGGVEGLTDSLPPDIAAKAQGFLGDKSKAEELLNSPKIQALIKQILKKTE